jgi:hypothetical protein
LEGDLAVTSAHLDTATYNTVADYLTALSELITTPAGQQLAEEQFRALRQSPDESVLQYAAKVRSKFREAYPAENHETSRENKRQLITGLASPHLAQSVARAVPLDTTTFSKLVSEIQRLYAADLMVLTHHHSRKGAGSLNAMGYSSQGRPAFSNQNKRGGHQGNGKNSSKGADEPRDADGVLRNRAGETVKCYECEKNHYARNCPNKPKANGNQPGAGRGQPRGRGGRGGRGRGRGQINNIGNSEEQPHDNDPSGLLDQHNQAWEEREKEAFGDSGN